MDTLRHYKPTTLESWINQKYQEAGIRTAYDLDIDVIAEVFDITIATYKGPSHAQWDDDFAAIFINDSLPEESRRERFFHELGHPLMHEGNQHLLPHAFNDLQEMQAGLFQLYAALPYYIVVQYEDHLQSPHAVSLIAYEFKLPTDLVRRRLEQIAARIQKGQKDERIFDSVPRYKEPRIISHSMETYRMLAKLSWLAAQKGRKVNWGGK